MQRWRLQEKVAINKEVLVAVSNSALLSGDGKFGMLKMWIDGVQRAGVKNFLIIAIDKNVGACIGMVRAPWEGLAHRVALQEGLLHAQA